MRAMMREKTSKVTARGQVSIPSTIREHHHIKVGQRLLFLDDGTVITLIPIQKDPIRVLKGFSSGKSLTESLLRDRQRERLLERKR